MLTPLPPAAAAGSQACDHHPHHAHPPHGRGTKADEERHRQRYADSNKALKLRSLRLRFIRNSRRLTLPHAPSRHSHAAARRPYAALTPPSRRLAPSAISLRPLRSRLCPGFFRILLVAQSRRHQEVVQENHERNVGRLRFAIEGLRS